MSSARDVEAARAKRLARTSLFAALAMVLSFIETMIPLPVALPGVKLGLSNVAVLIALYVLDARSAAAVAVVKVLVTGFIFGSPMMIAYSAGGTFLAFCGMLVCHRFKSLSIVVTSMVAAILHNTGQLLVAAAMLQSWSVMISIAPLAIAACITGALTGIVARAVLPLADPPSALPVARIDDDSFAALKLTPGAHVAFIGVNGSGKSSYARALVDRDDLGSVMLAFQDADDQIVAQTVRDDVAFGLEQRGVARQRMEHVVDRELARIGLDSLENAPIEELSGGQKQLVVLAGLCVLVPDVIIFDETTSMMDDDSRAVFYTLVNELTRAGTCVICITQDINEAMLADRIALFSRGEICVVAMPTQLRAREDLLEEAGLGSIAYPDGREAACENIPLFRDQEDLLIPAAGEVVGLRGKNGVGKSTALDRLAEKLGTRAAIARQQPECQLFAQYAFDDVAFGVRNEGCDADEVEARVTRTLTQVGLDVDQARVRSPFSYSGGEKRRLALACILVLDRPIFLFDEPTSGLDPVNAARIWELVDQLRREGRGVVVASHDAGALSDCADKVFVLHAQRVDDDATVHAADKAADDVAAVHVADKAAVNSTAVQAAEAINAEDAAEESSVSVNESATPGLFRFGVYRQRSSFAHRLDPRAKVVFALLFLVSCAFAQGLVGMILIIAAAVVQILLAQTSPYEVWRSLRAFVPLIIFVVIFDILFVVDGEVLLALGGLSITAGGILFAVESAVRFACALIGAAQLMATTSPVQLADALSSLLSPLKRFGAYIDNLVFGINTTFRFIPVLTEEYARVRQAQADRGATFTHGSLAGRVRSFVPILVPLFTSVFARADTLAMAIQNRSYSPEDVRLSGRAVKRTCIRAYRIRCVDVALIAAGCLLLAVCILTDIL